MMRSWQQYGLRLPACGWILALGLLAWGACGSTPAPAQVISIKTAPIATGSQFQLYPSQARGMGNLSLAVDDTLGDAFVNPATAARLNGTWAFTAPTYYTITGRDGHARTVSVGTLLNRGEWFGGMAVALQQLDPGPRPSRSVAFSDMARNSVVQTSSNSYQVLRERAVQNHYVTLLGGAELTDRVSFAGMMRWAGLNAMEGVDLLYPGNDGLRQDGYRFDMRLGLFGEWAETSISALLLHNRIDMEHDVRYVTDVFGWQPDVGPTIQTEHHSDRTNTWGLHLEYVRPLGTDGWRLGTVLTANRKGHPKIPNYDLMDIPRDPGTSWAYNVGAGVARTLEGTTVGADLVFEPIVSETWVEAQNRIALENGGVIQPGEKTVQNDFTFANTTLRTGLEERGDGWEFQLGLMARTTRYWLTQKDRVEQRERDQYEGWTEWRVTWGGGVDLGSVRLQYTGHVTLGTGRPGVASTPFRGTTSFASSSFVVAPRGALAVQNSSVFTHQISLTIPLHNEDE